MLPSWSRKGGQLGILALFALMVSLSGIGSLDFARSPQTWIEAGQPDAGFPVLSATEGGRRGGRGGGGGSGGGGTRR